MRTTVTLDPDVEALLQIAMKEHRLSFKDALNAAVRLGLTGSKTRRRFAQKTFALGPDQKFPPDKALAAAEAREEEELAKKLTLRT